MSESFDLSYIDVIDFLEALEIDNIRREGSYEARFSCPYPGHDNADASASAYMNVETTAWYCHGCKRKGNAISFCASMLNVSPIKARRLLREAYAPHTLDPDKRNVVEELRMLWARNREMATQISNEPIDEWPVDQFAVDWQAVADAGEDAPPALRYMLERGFNPETLEQWEFGYDERSDRVVIPVRDERQQLMGFKGRAWDDRHPKYLVIGDPPDKNIYGFPRYYTGLVVFGLDQFMNYMEVLEHGEPSQLVVCEGELNAVALWQMGHHNAVALSGSKLTSHQERLLRSWADEIVFFFDFDKAGIEGMWGWDDEHGEHHYGALERLAPYASIRLVGEHDDDPAGYLKDGREDEVDRLIESAESYTVARLLRSW